MPSTKTKSDSPSFAEITASQHRELTATLDCWDAAYDQVSKHPYYNHLSRQQRVLLIRNQFLANMEMRREATKEVGT